MTDGPLHYINTEHRDSESPGRNKGGEGLGRRRKTALTRTSSDLTDKTVFLERRTAASLQKS